MSLVVLLRGVNVGGHRRFRPAELVKTLAPFDVVNIGAAGTFVVRKPGARGKFVAAMRKALPFETAIVLCDGSEITRLLEDNPFGRTGPGVVRFVSVMESEGAMPGMPIVFPETGKWLVRVVGARGQFVFGEYRRDMKTIQYLGKLDKLFNGKLTTRNWNTINQIAKAVAAP
jgi:uncharacterized protein (DUF1697 family)